MSSTGSKRPSRSRSRQRSVAGIGFEFAAGVAGMSLLGYWLGGYYGNAKLGLVIGASLGLLGSMYNIVRVALRVSARGANSREESGGEENSRGKNTGEVTRGTNKQ